MTRIELVYCSACGREVRVALPTAPRHGDGHASIPDGRPVCLDFGEECERGGAGPDGSPARCPVFHVPAAVMGIQRARAGLGPGPRATLHAPCEGCGVVTLQERAGKGYAVCGLCGSTNPVV